MVKKIKGSNLIEIVLAIALLGMVIVIISGVFISGLESIKKGKEIAVALNIAKKKIDEIKRVDLTCSEGIYKKELLENIKGCNPDTLIPEDSYIPWDSTGNQEIEGTEILGGRDYNFFISIEGSENNLKKLTVKVDFSVPGDRGSKIVELTTLLARKLTLSLKE